MDIKTSAVLIAALLAACRTPPPAAAPSADRPLNVIIVYADDLGYGDLGCYGAEKIKTPHLDRMAAEGVRFTSFYSCYSVCSPSRYGLLTGRYPIRGGVNWVFFPDSPDGIDDGEVTLAEALRERGYATACVGKWHLGHLPRYLPTRHGFDRWFGIPYSNDMDNPARGFPKTPLLRDETVVEQPPDLDTLTRRYTEEAVRFIEASRDRPFFLYFPHTMPHVPLAASKAFRGRSAGGLYGDVVEEIDWSVGEVMAALKRLGLDERTIVIFSSDNGPWLVKGAHGGSAGPLRQGKGTTFEGGIRVPCLVRWPGRISAGRVEGRPAIMLDWLPTLVALAGGPARRSLGEGGGLPPERVIDGRDIRGMLFGTGGRGEEEFFFYLREELQAHRSGPWKLKKPFKGQIYGRPEEHSWLLYNLEEDPSERRDLAGQHPEIVERLRRQMDEFQKSLGPLPQTKR